jgi:hypothetical protein
MEGELKRDCPTCLSELVYKNRKVYLHAIKANKPCRSCAQTRKSSWNKGLSKDTDERVARYSRSHSLTWDVQKLEGRTVWNDGLTTDDQRVKLNIDGCRATLLRRYSNEEIVPWNKGKKFEAVSGERSPSKRPEVRAKLREANLTRLSKTGMVPGFNPTACELFDKINDHFGWNGQHALAGGEYRVCGLGYSVDYYEAAHNIVIEFDEVEHRKTRNRIKDDYRQSEIEKLLHCTFIRIPERESHRWKEIIQLSLQGSRV